MASTESQQLIGLFQSMDMKGEMTRQFRTGKSTGEYDAPLPPEELGQTLKIETLQFKGRNLFRLSPKNGAGSTQVLFIHGGGYVSTFSKFHWEFLGRLVSEIGGTVITPDYPLSREKPYPAAFDFSVDLYRDLITRVDPQKMILMGDSAGGGLCLALAQKMCAEKQPLPRQMILLSPWLDVTMSDPLVHEIDPLDPFLSLEGCVTAGKLYAGENDPSHPSISPINGSLSGLPPMTIFTGTRDMLIADARKLKSLLEKQGVDFNYYEFEEMFHVWMLFDLPESRQVIEKILSVTR